MFGLNELSTARMRVAFAFSASFAVVWCIVSLFSGALAYVLMGTLGTAVTVTLIGLLTGGLAIAYALTAAAVESSKMLVLTAQENIRRISAQADALAEGAVIQENVNTGPGELQVNNAPVVQESVRLVPFQGSGRLVDGVDERDLAHFVDRIPLVGFSKRAWLGQTLPSGRTVATFEEYDALIHPLVKAGVIQGRKEGAAGQLTVQDPKTIKQVLGLTTTSD